MKQRFAPFGARTASGRKRASQAALLALCVAATSVACGGDDASGSDGGVIKLGYVASLSGPGGVFAEQGLQSMKLAVKEINDSGVLDSRIEVVTVDDASDPKTSAEVCQRLVSQEKVDVILGVQNSANRASCLPLAESAGKTPYLYATPYEGGECRENFFVDGEVPNQQVTPIIEYLIDGADAKGIFMMGSDYAAPRGTNAYAREQFESSGVEVVGEEYAPLNTTDFASLISKALDSGADGVFVSFIGSDYVAFLKQWRETPGTDKLTLSSPIPPFGAGEAAEGILAAFSYFPSLDNEANVKYKADLEEMFGDKAETPSILSVMPYNALWLYTKAVEEAGTADKDAVRDALRKVSFDGPSGLVSYNEVGHAALPMYVARLAGDPLAGGEEILKEYPPVDPDSGCDG